MLSDEGIACALELNTIPGFTTHSLLPMAAAKVGFTMGNLCSKIVEEAYFVKREAKYEIRFTRYASRDTHYGSQKEKKKKQDEKNII